MIAASESRLRNGWSFAVALAALALLLLVIPASAGAVPSRTWTETPIDPGYPIYDPQVASPELGGAVTTYSAQTPYVYGTTRQQILASRKLPGSSTFAPAEKLEIEPSYAPAVDASWVGGAVAVWWEAQRVEVRMATLDPLASEWNRGVTLDTAYWGFGYQQPSFRSARTAARPSPTSRTSAPATRDSW